MAAISGSATQRHPTSRVNGTRAGGAVEPAQQVPAGCGPNGSASPLREGEIFARPTGAGRQLPRRSTARRRLFALRRLFFVTSPGRHLRADIGLAYDAKSRSTTTSGNLADAPQCRSSTRPSAATRSPARRWPSTPPSGTPRRPDPARRATAPTPPLQVRVYWNGSRRVQYDVFRNDTASARCGPGSPLLAPSARSIEFLETGCRRQTYKPDPGL